MRSSKLLLTIAGAGLLTFSAPAFGQSAPFGLSWGPVDVVPRPSLATREDNVTLLMYRQERLPSHLRDTEEIVLEICKKEGLQQIVWISRSLTESEAHQKRAALLTEGLRRYGQPDTDQHGTQFWNTGRMLIAEAAVGDTLRRIIMVSWGPDFEACSDQHKALTGHGVSDHWMRFLPRFKE